MFDYLKPNFPKPTNKKQVKVRPRGVCLAGGLPDKSP